MIELALFDCDGTLVDSQDVIYRAMKAAFEGAELPPPARADVRRIIGLSLPQAIQTVAPDLPAARVGDLVTEYKKCFTLQRDRPDFSEPLFPGTVACLEQLSAMECLLGVATGKSRRGLTAVLKTHGLSRHFVTLQTADDGPSKPNPHMVERALAETGADPKKTIVIGDTTFDMMMAENAGVRGIGVAWGYHDPQELMSAGALTTVASFDELTNFLSELK